MLLILALAILRKKPAWRTILIASILTLIVRFGLGVDGSLTWIFQFSLLLAIPIVLPLELWIYLKRRSFRLGELDLAAEHSATSNSCTSPRMDILSSNQSKSEKLFNKDKGFSSIDLIDLAADILLWCFPFLALLVTQLYLISFIISRTELGKIEGAPAALMAAILTIIISLISILIARKLTPSRLYPYINLLIVSGGIIFGFYKSADYVISAPYFALSGTFLTSFLCERRKNLRNSK